MPLQPGYRAAGLLLHATSLPSRYGIGDLGPSAFQWIDRLHEAGLGWWQSLPLGPTGYGDSPYQCLSSFAGNGLLMSPELLIEDGLLQPADCKGAFSSTSIDYDAVIPFKHRLLKILWNRFTSGARKDLIPEYEQFCERMPAGWKTMRCFGPSGPNTTTPITLIGRKSWCAACHPPSSRRGASLPMRSTRFAWRSSCCSGRADG